MAFNRRDEPELQIKFETCEAHGSKFRRVCCCGFPVRTHDIFYKIKEKVH